MTWKRFFLVALVMVLTGLAFRATLASSSPSNSPVPGEALDTEKLADHGIFLDPPNASRKLTEAQVLEAVALVEPVRVQEASSVSVRRVQYTDPFTEQRRVGWMVTLDGVKVPLTGRPDVKQFNNQLHVVVDSEGKPIFASSYQ